MTPHLLLTVDTELSNFPREVGIAGRLGDEEWGLAKLLELFEELGVRATFFLDAYGSDTADLEEQRRAAELIVERGHDLQLHTHPGPSFSTDRALLRSYALEEQVEVLQLGCDRLEQWTGRRPVLHRAGDWAADEQSLQALARLKFRADFSASPWSRNCGLDRHLVSGNGWTRIEGMLCAVGTCYHDRLTGRIRRVDLGGVSFLEAMEVLSMGIDPLILTLHSFSFLRFNRGRTRFWPDPSYISRLRNYCTIARDRLGYQTVTALEAVTEIESAADGSLPWAALPVTGVVSSCAGLLKSVRERLRA